MRDGFIKVAAATNAIKVCDVAYNISEIKRLMNEADKLGAKITVFPELCITGYTAGEMFTQKTLIDGAFRGLLELKDESRKYDGAFFVGLPMEVRGALYDAVACLQGGEIKGIVPKQYLPDYGGYMEAHYFTSGVEVDVEIPIEDEYVTFGTSQLFEITGIEGAVIGVEIGQDNRLPNQPAIEAVMNGATIIVNPSANDALAAKETELRHAIEATSDRLTCGYIVASTGDGESTTDSVFAGKNFIFDRGYCLAENKCYTPGVIVSEIDVERIMYERRKMHSFVVKDDFYRQELDMTIEETKLTRKISASPFIPEEKALCKERMSEILRIQAESLKKRIVHTNAKTCVVGISGGLDSTLALIVTAMAFDLLKKERKDIIAVTMPGFGTSDRTYENAVSMIKSFGATFLEIPIRDAVTQHFKDIDHDITNHNVTYENSQARERTQILMDLSNKHWGMVIGTGDMSELALGWATYSGDHMSMYGVNGSVPKTLVRVLVSYYADATKDKKLSSVLKDVLDTPVSPELLPPSDGEIAQKTEELVGPYELHDFVLFNVLRAGARPRKIYRMAKVAFAGVYDDETIKKWMAVFYRRFFASQFKRSCLPDGPRVGTCALSPRGDLKMPSDACAALWLREVEEL